MPVPANEIGSIYDTISVLKRVDGSFAKWAAALHRSKFESTMRRTQALGPAVVEDIDRFLQAIGQCRDDSFTELSSALSHATLENCAQLAILLGQFDWQFHAVGASPNAFSSEIELIAMQSGDVPRRWLPISRSTRSIRNALRALAAARRITVCEHLKLLASAAAGGSGPNWSIGEVFRTEWLTSRGKFSTPFDYKYIRALSERLAAQGVSVPGPEGIIEITKAFVRAWSQTIPRVFNSLSPSSRLRRIIRTESLLSVDLMLSRQEVHLLNRELPTLSLTQEQILSQAKPELCDAVEAWLEALSLPSMNSEDTGSASVAGVSPLIQRPIVAGAKRFSLALPHRLSVDLSALNDAVWGHEYGEKYFRARGATVEELALEEIAQLTGGKAIAQAMYASSDGSTHGEVDGVVIWGDVCIILEGKGGFLSLAARRGSSEAAISDMTTTISHGFFQAARLVRLTTDERVITLRAENGQELLLDAQRLRRAYVVIPTADDYHAVSTRMLHLWENKILPKMATPLIISVQELLRLTATLTHPEIVVAYLEYREEILRNEWIQLADEAEILGAFIGGLDVIGECVYELRDNGVDSDLRSRDRRHMIIIDPMNEERFLRPWTVKKFGRSLDGDPQVQPPKRGTASIAGQLERMWKKQHDLDSLACAHALSPELLETILFTSPKPPGKQPIVRTHTNISAISYRKGTPLARIRHDTRVRNASKTSRYVLYIEHGRLAAQLTHVERGQRHACFRKPKVNLALRSNIPIYDIWFEEFEKRRIKPFDRNIVAALEAEGLPRDTAVGIVRAQIVDRVRGLADAGNDITRSAALWLGPIKNIARRDGISVSDISLTVTQQSDVLRMVESRELPQQHVERLIERIMASGKPARDVATEQQLLAETNDHYISTALQEAIANNPGAVHKLQAGHNEVENFLIGQVIRKLDQRPRIDILRTMLRELIRRAG